MLQRGHIAADADNIGKTPQRSGEQRFHAMQIKAVISDAVARIDEGVSLLLGTLFSRKDYQRDRRGKHRRDQCGERNEPPGTVGFRAAAIRIVCQDADALRAGEILQRLCKRAGQFRRERVGKANIYRALCAVMFYRAEQHLTAHRAAVDRAGGIGGNNVRLPVCGLLRLRCVLAVRKIDKIVPCLLTQALVQLRQQSDIAFSAAVIGLDGIEIGVSRDQKRLPRACILHTAQQRSDRQHGAERDSQELFSAHRRHPPFISNRSCGARCAPS